MIKDLGERWKEGERRDGGRGKGSVWGVK